MNSIICLQHTKYDVFFDQKNGNFIRIEKKGFKEPFWAQTGPELLDISITNWCDRECDFCYKNSNRKGKHISIDDYEIILKQASDLNVLQVALGGGNPNQHPNFIDILRLAREKYNIVPSYSTNGNGLTEDILIATKNYCGAVAVSAYAPFDQMEYAIKKFAKYSIKPNIHFVLDKNSIETAISWLEIKRPFFKDINAIIFLNYKPVGDGKDNRLLLKNSSRIQHFFELVKKNTFKIQIGFDSCMVPGIVKNLKEINFNFIEPCDAGRFSAYISEDLKMYPCSFMIEKFRGVDLEESKMIDIWRDSEIFIKTRENLKNIRCEKCEQQKLCLNGCPFLSEINICETSENNNERISD